jgi:hypothetical protein
MTNPANPETWPRGASPAAVSITRIHGDWKGVNYRLAEIVRGKVRCMHVDTGELVECTFSKDSGPGPISARTDAAVGRAITSDGQPGGEFIVAAKIRHDRSVPCIDLPAPPRHGLTAGAANSAGGSLVIGSASVRHAILQHYYSCQSSSSHPHPDGGAGGQRRRAYILTPVVPHQRHQRSRG